MAPVSEQLLPARSRRWLDDWRALGLVPALTLLLLLGPLIGGLVGTLLPAFGYLPALGGESLTLTPWYELLTAPGITTGIVLSLGVGLGSTALSLAIVMLFCAAWHGSRLFQRLNRCLSPLLAIPHVTVAFGLAFLLTPSGWIVRALVPLIGLERPPDWIIIQDPWGLSLILGLVLKEVPFLFLMTLAALNQINARDTRCLARCLGYGAVNGWLKVVFPRIYSQLRLPVFAVLAYSASSVEMALVLGPTTPPPLAVQLLRWFNDPDLSQRFPASAGAVLQLGLVMAAMVGWWGLERGVVALGRRWLWTGRRGRRDGVLRFGAAILLLGCFGLALFSLLAMALWSVTGLWRYPDLWPDTLTLRQWQQHSTALLTPAWHTLSIGLAASLVALGLVLGCLEHEARVGRRLTIRALWLLYLPLLVPQIAFLFGTQILLISTALDGHWLALLWSHLIFVLPYVYLSLVDPYRTWDERYGRSARCLGATESGVFWRVKLPMLTRPVLVALAVGFAVSIGQYLPTVFAGNGRFPTLTTEAVALSAGNNRRVMGMYAMLQMSMPWLMFALAQAIPALLFRHRRGLQVIR